MSKITAIRLIYQILIKRGRAKAIARGACAAHLVIQGVFTTRQEAHRCVKAMFSN